MSEPATLLPSSDESLLATREIAEADLLRVADRGELYAVLDACVVENSPTLASEIGPEGAACLYLGRAASSYGDKAPYLFKADRGFVAMLTSRFAGQPWGCYLATSAGFERVRLHLRSWLTVRSPAKQRWLFRYYDPRLLPTFLASSTADELAAFFGPIAAFAWLDERGGARSAHLANPPAVPPPRRGVGEAHQLSEAHVGAFRRRSVSDQLVASFTGTSQTARRDPANDDVLVTNPDGGVMRMALGKDGFVGAVTSPLGRAWRTTSCEDGKPSGMTLPSGQHVAVEHDDKGNVASISRDGKPRFQARHDVHGRMEDVAFPDGTRAQTRYCDAGRAGIVDPAGIFVASRSDRLERTEHFSYAGDFPSGAVDGGGNRSAFAAGRERRPDWLTYADGSRETYLYDPAGHLQHLARADGSALEITCDGAGRPTRIAAADGGVAEYTYDGAGRLVSARNANTRLSWRYDDGGRLIEERQGATVVAYTYDAAGTLTGLTYPTGETVQYERDADLRTAAVIDWSGGRYGFEYAPMDAGWRLTAPSGVMTTVWQNPTGLMTGVRAQAGDAVLFESAFAYDDEDRLRERSDSGLGGERYAYDAEGQILAVERASGGEAFAYDGAGNRTQCGEGPATFNALNQLLTQGATRCAYDGRGNLIERQGGERAWRFRYDGFDRLFEADDGSGTTVCYAYDPLGRRIRKEVRGGGAVPVRTTSYVWAGEQLIREVEHDGAASGEPTARDYLYFPQTFTPLLLREAGVSYQYHTGPGGVPMRLTAPGGRSVWEAEIDVYGAARNITGTMRQPLRLPGQYHDAETDLHYNRFRYYDPALGRYISRDPIGYAGGLNLYLYAGNDPVNRADPLGLWWKTALSILGAVAVGALVVLTAPISGPLLIIAAGAAAGATGFALNEALNEKHFCASCIAKAALKGAVVGAVAAVPFLFVPAAAGVGAFMAAGAGSGFLNYAGTTAVNGTPWSWHDAAISTGIGAATAGVGRYAAGLWAGRGLAPAEPEATPSAAGDEPLPSTTPRPVSARDQYMGSTPSKYSRTGSQVVERMRTEGNIVGDGPLTRGNPNTLQLRNSDGSLTTIDHTVDMAHRTDAVSWWNETGRFTGAKSPEVRQFMLDPDNYQLQPRSINRSEGARLGQRYLPPEPPNFDVPEE